MFDINKNRFFVYDFETESLNHGFAKPWDIAWALFEKGKLVEKCQFYVKWKNFNISKGAAEKTGYERKKQDIEEKGLPAKEVIKKLDEIMYDENTFNVGHNIIGFDSLIYNVARRELGLKTDFSFIKRAIDTNAIARGIKMDRLPDEHDNFIAWQYRMLDARIKGLKTKISTLCGEYVIPYEEDELHSADYDVEKNVEIFKRQMQEVDIYV